MTSISRRTAPKRHAIVYKLDLKVFVGGLQKVQKPRRLRRRKAIRQLRRSYPSVATSILQQRRYDSPNIATASSCHFSSLRQDAFRLKLALRFALVICNISRG